MEAFSNRHDHSTPLSALLPSQENRKWAENSKLGLGVVFQVTSLHLGAIQEPTQSDLIKTEDTFLTRVSEARVKDQILELKRL